MRVLVVHNRSRLAAPNGEEVAVRVEMDAMRSRGWTVQECMTSSNDLVGPDQTRISRLRASPRAVWNGTAMRLLHKELDRFQPDVVHLHNDFPLLGPAIHQHLADWAVPYLQTIHNHRYACVNGAFFRDGRSCTDCLGRRVPLPGILHGCGGGRTRSTYIAGWIAANQAATRRSRPLLAANSRFVADQLIAHGAPAEQVTHRYNLAWPTPQRLVPDSERRGVVAAGRLDAVKGFDVLIDAWMRCEPRGERLTIIGDGPHRDQIERRAAGRDDIVFAGVLSHAETLNRLCRARLVVVPSRWPEPFGRVAMEALHHGTPALVADVGGLPEAVTPDVPALVFPAGKVDVLADRLVHLLDGADLPTATELATNTESRFGINAFLDRTEELYRQVGAVRCPPAERTP